MRYSIYFVKNQILSWKNKNPEYVLLMQTFFQETKKPMQNVAWLSWSGKKIWQNICMKVFFLIFYIPIQFILSEIDAKNFHRNVMNIKG